MENYDSTASCKIKTSSSDLILFADASDLGWGACLDGRKIQGEWTEDQQSLHINAKEILAVLFMLKQKIQPRYPTLTKWVEYDQSNAEKLLLIYGPHRHIYQDRTM